MERERGANFWQGTYMIQLQNAQESYRQKRIDPITVKTSNIDTLIIYYVFSLLEHIEQHTKAIIVCMPTFRKQLLVFVPVICFQQITKHIEFLQ